MPLPKFNNPIKMNMPFSSKLLLLTVFLTGFLQVYVHGDVHYHDFVLAEKNFTRLCNTTTLLVVNGMFPGPTLYAHKGDTFYVNVHNQGSIGVTIHWHGVKQPRNPWNDGPEYITQCPIEPGMNYTYEVILSDEEGTVWWHAHSDWTRATIHGAIVVYPKKGTPYPFLPPDGEKVFVLSSWYGYDVNRIVGEDLITGADTPRSIAYTINGEPGDLCPCSQDTTHRWVVDYGKTYLIRIVNAVMNAELYLAIANHTVTVVGMDGNYVKPFPSTNLVIGTGQTMDVLLTANQSLSHYYIMTRQYYTARPDASDFDRTNTTAILVYSGNYTAPKFPAWPYALPGYDYLIPANRFWAQLKSLASKDHPIDVPMNPKTKMYVVVSMNQIVCPNATCAGINGNRFSSSMNNISFDNPSIDVLQAYYWNMSGIFTEDFPDWPYEFYNFTSDGLPFNVTTDIQATKVKMLEYNEEVEITFQGTEALNASENHPMHLHGYSFYVMGYGIGNFDNETDPKYFNYVDPLRVTTFSIPARGWVTVRFKANNPGVWLWHCHLDRHYSWGMDTVIIVKDGDTPETSLRGPPANMPACSDSARRINRMYLKFPDGHPYTYGPQTH